MEFISPLIRNKHGPRQERSAKDLFARDLQQKETSMDLRSFSNWAPWEWPEDAAQIFLQTLADPRAEKAERLLAADLAGDLVAMNDDLARALLTIVGSSQEPEALRGQAAVSLGPVLELADLDIFDDPEAVPVSEETFHRITGTLSELYKDDGIPKFVRRSILEASVRAEQDWHAEAVQNAYESLDEDWNLTAVFCMRFVPGFKDQILHSLQSGHPDIHYQAVIAAGNWGLEEAWPHIATLARSDATDKPLRLAAIDALSNLRPDESLSILIELTSEEDEDIVDAAHESLVMAEGSLGYFDDEEEE